MIWMRSRMAVTLSVIMVMALSLGAVAAPQVNDVPKDHWAYEAVMKLVDKGYLGVYEDGTFKGDEPVSRYLLAFVVYKMLSDIEKGTVAATGEDMAILREVANELRGEIVPLVNQLDVRMNALEAQGNEDSKALTAERQERKAEAAEILEGIEKQAGQLKAVDSAVANALSGVARLEGSLAAEKASKDKLIMTLLEEQAAEKTVIAAQFSKVQEDKKASDEAFKALENDVEVLKKLIGSEQGGTLADLTAGISAEGDARKALEEKLVAADAAHAKALEDVMAAADKAHAKALEDAIAATDASQTKALEDAIAAADAAHAKALEDAMAAADKAHAKALEDAMAKTDAAHAKELEDAMASLKVLMESRRMEDDKQLALAVESLTGLLAEEKGARAEADSNLSAKIEGAETAIVALSDKDKALDSKDADLNKKLDQLAAKVEENSFNATALVLKVASEQADRNDGYDASIASLRKAMDAANLNITTLKSDLANVTGRLANLETSVSLIKSSLESAVTQIVTVKNDLATLALKHNTLEAKVAAMQVDINNKLKTAEQGANDLLVAQSWEAQEREKALEQKVNSLEAKLAEQEQSLRSEMKKIQGFGIIGLVVGAVGAIVGIIALFLPVAP